MRTSALRVTIGAYAKSEWHVTLIEDTYERGVLVNSELVYGPIYCAEHQVEHQAVMAVRRLMATERARVDVPAAG